MSGSTSTPVTAAAAPLRRRMNPSTPDPLPRSTARPARLVQANQPRSTESTAKRKPRTGWNTVMSPRKTASLVNATLGLRGPAAQGIWSGLVPLRVTEVSVSGYTQACCQPRLTTPTPAI